MSDTLTPKARAVPWYHSFHRWSKWGKVQQRQHERLPILGTESVITGGHMVVWTDNEQDRICEICGAVQTRTI